MPKKVFVFAQDAEGKATSEIVGLKFVMDDKTEISVDPEQLSDEIRQRAFWHGLSQKIGDSYAGAAKADDATAFAKEAVNDTIAQLYAGDWRATAEGGPKAPSDLAIALARVTGKTEEEAQAFVDKMSDEQKKTYKKKAKIAAILAELTSERAAARAKKLAEKAAKAAADGSKDESEDEEEITLE